MRTRTRSRPCFVFRFLLPAIALFLAASSAPFAHAAKLRLPPWLAEAARRFPAVPKDTVAVVLHDEALNTVASNGRITTVVMRAVRIVTRDGRPAARAYIPYDSGSKKISGFRAWIIRPDGEGKTYGMKEAVDIALSPEAVYAESRSIVLSAEADAYDDCVFAYEYTKEDRGVFGQDVWVFQAAYPVALSRTTYKIPKDWRITAGMVNREPLDPSVNGNTYTWELRDLPAVKIEPLSPPIGHIVPRLHVDIIPPDGTRAPPRLSFGSWQAVSEYGSRLHEKPCAPDASVTAKTNALLAAAGPSPWERINALARHAQAINYVSIEMNIGKGGGYTPRAAADVLKTGYGDCKDKTALLRAMLTAAGIESYSVTAYSGNRYHVIDGWTTPMQFNHCITAIKIDDPALRSPAIVEHPRLGRLLFFDPTDPFTPLGDLDYDQQGSLVLVLAGERGELVRLPFTPPSANHLDLTITAKLTPTGAIGARIVEKFTGQPAAYARGEYRSTTIKFTDIIRDWINGSVRAAKLVKSEVVDSQESGEFTHTVDFVAPSYAQPMRDKLLVFKPAIMNRRDFVPLTEPERKFPVILEPRSYSESADIYIPENFDIDELPRAVETTETFGRYSAKCEFDAQTRQVRYRRSLTMDAAEIPARDYARVRRFFETIRKAEQSPVVLSRKS